MQLVSDQHRGSSVLTLPAALEKAAKMDLAGTGLKFLRDGGESVGLSYPDILHQVIHAAGSLRRLGLRPGDRFGLLEPDQHTFVILFLAALHSGIIPVPLAPPASFGGLDVYCAHLKSIVDVTGLSHILTSSPIKRIIDLDEKARIELSSNVLSQAKFDIEPASISRDSIAFLQFTSGSTLQPRGVTVTHGNLIANMHAIVERLAIRPDDITCSWLPLFHDMGLIGMLLTPIFIGIKAILMPPSMFLKRPLEWLKAISDGRCTISYAPNFAYGLCVKRVPDSELQNLVLSSWRVAGCGAEPIDYRTIENFCDKFKKCGFNARAFVPSYGLAESTLAVAFEDIEHGMKVDAVKRHSLARGVADPESGGNSAVKIVCCGRPFAGHELMIAGDNLSPCPERVIGEILVRGPSIMKGYYNNQEATAAAMHEGWLRTGDLGYLVGGKLYVCGRKKDLVIIAGRNYYPSDIEAMVSQVEGVRTGNVIAFSISGEGVQEELVIAAEIAAGIERGRELVEAIRSHLLETLGVKASHVLLLRPGTLPKTSSGKLQRQRAKELYVAGTLASHSRTTGVGSWAYCQYLTGRLVRNIRRLLGR
ncbi:MAG: fatty acyl-AMP ligase [Deltaproteobacteria bacterium]|nr:fatty acyl-AMP ligase [Deltaproteobacteria bacterium]